MAERKRVLVIGAGFACLSVAYHLPRDQFEVIILEAGNRVGGRVWPHPILGDLGGQWIHEACPENPICELLAELKIPMEPRQPFKRTYFRSDGRPFDDEMHALAQQKFFQAIRVSQRRKGITKDTSQQELLDELMSTIEDDALKEHIIFQRSLYEQYEGAPLRELSVALNDLYQTMKGGNRTVQGGYGTLLDLLLEKTETVHLQSPVKAVHHFDNGVELVLEDESTLEGDYCVCTVSVGVLQRRKIQFVPELSSKRWNAIDSIGMGTLNKIALKFPHRFWEDVGFFGIMDKDPAKNKSFLASGRDTDTLLCFIGGDASYRVDNGNNGVPDQEVIKETLDALRTIFPKVPEPLDFVVTRWNTDPFAYGSYSFTKVGCTEESYDEVIEPIRRLRFAVEATSKAHHGTVHGAWSTGKREAERLRTEVTEA